MIIHIIFLIIFFASTNASGPRVTLKDGIAEGHYLKTLRGREFEAFEGVPYAKPPVGELRFQEPQPNEPWENVWKANVLPHCIQYLHMPVNSEYPVIGHEDCLYLNIYKPKGNIKNLDVIVYIHGGAFMFNAGSVHRPHYIMNKDLVLVMVHYRLGPLGFLSLEDDVLPGNNGMKDQALALRWVKNNIESFGGNSNSITIVGMSAGGASVNLHTLSPLSRGLFHKAFAQSGTSLNIWALAENSREKAHKLGDLLGCSSTDSQRLINCLKTRPAYQIVKAVSHFQKILYNPYAPFGPVIDKWSEKPFLPEHPLILIKNNEIADVPMIFSFSDCEGLYPAIDFARKQYLEQIHANWNDVLPSILDYNYTVALDEMDEVSQVIREEYLQDKPLTTENYYDFVKILTDRLFTNDIAHTVNLYSHHIKSPIYVYKFSYVGDSGLATVFAPDLKFTCASHGDDTLLVLPMTNDAIRTETDLEMSDILVDMLASFIKNGYPVLKNVDWKPVIENDANKLNYLHIRATNDMKMDEDVDIGNAAFWNSLPLQENENLFSNAKDEL